LAGEEENGAKYCIEPRTLSFDVLITQISCGVDHALFVTADSSVFAIGSNKEGQLGVGDSQLQNTNVPIQVDTLPRGLKVKEVSSGGWHCVAIFQTGELYTWGKGTEGQLGSGRFETKIEPFQVET